MTSTHVAEGKYCRLHIRVRAEGCGHGRTVGIGGSCKRLGFFDPRKVLPLVTTPESYPVWFSVEPILVPAEELLTYKFCIIEGGQFKSFEDLPSARSVIPSSVDTIVENIFNPSLIERSMYESEAKLLQVLDEKTQKRDSAAAEDIGVHGSLYVVCYHLPVVVERTDSVPSFNVTWGNSLIARTDGVIADAMRTHWVGAVRVPGPPLTDTERAELVGILLRMSCVVIFVEEETSAAAYYGYCKEVLWPVFHNVDQLDGQGIWQADPSMGLPVAASAGSMSSTDFSKAEESDSHWNYTMSHTTWWEAYVKVNQMFCDSIKDRLHPQDVVWIHDYHLMMLPSMLRRDTNPALSIVFYLHIPFPTSQIFRSLPSASSIMKSLLQADVVGFHTYQYARHFLNSGQRTVGATSHTLPGGLFSIMSGGREVVLSMSVVSVEPTRMDAVLADPAVHEEAAALRANYSGKKIITSVDLCQRLSGSVYKLAALECFLDEFGESRQGDVVMVLRAVHSSARANDEKQTSLELTSTVRRLNEKYGRVVVDYEEPEVFSLRRRVALWLAGDVFLNTSVREGLQMNAMEFIYARKDMKKNPGVVVVSDMSAAASLLNGSIKISPFNTRQVADALGKALSMPIAEADRRRQRDLPYVTTKTGSLWCKQVLMDLKHGKKSSGSDSHFFQRAPYPSPLLFSSLAKNYSQAMLKDISPNLKRVFIFDYAGTLVVDEKQQIFFKQTMSTVSGKVPTPQMMKLLRELSEDSHNAVLVVTGLTRQKLGDVFESCPNVSVATSNGIECSWGVDVLTMDELDEARREEERVRANMGSHDIVYDDDFKSVSSAGSQKAFHDMNDENLRSIMKTPDEEEEEVVLGSFAHDDGQSDGEGAGTQRPLSFARTMENSTLRDSFMCRPEDEAGQMRPVPSYQSYEDYGMSEESSQQFLCTARPRAPWTTEDETFPTVDWDAVKAIAIPIISKFSARTNGTCLISSIPGIGWSYFNAEPEWGTRQASQLKVELEASLANFNVKVDSLVDGSVEVVPRRLNKGNIVKKFLQRVVSKRAGKLPTFMLAAGDGADDDHMFQAVKTLAATAPTQCLPQNLALYTVTVGKKRGSSAEYYVHDVADVEKMVREMVEGDNQ